MLSNLRPAYTTEGDKNATKNLRGRWQWRKRGEEMDATGEEI